MSAEDDNARAALLAHLAGGATQTCRAWAVTRRDGVVLGFTDHDCDLEFDGITFRASGGMSARAFAQTTGLSVDNSEALGVLSDAAIREADVQAGRYDGAELRCWRLRWDDPSARMLEFRGSFGEMTREGAAFRVELRGLSEAMNTPKGRSFQHGCSAVLGDGACAVNLALPAYRAVAALVSAEGGRLLRFAGLSAYAAGWFTRGRAEVTGGVAAGLAAAIKADRMVAGGLREIELWEPLGLDLAPGDPVTLTAGCDKRVATCKAKFNNINNFQGFPHIPGEDWLQAFPSQRRRNDGGKLRG